MYRFSGGRFGSTPPVTKNLIIINVVLLLGTMVLQQTGLNLNAFWGCIISNPLCSPPGRSSPTCLCMAELVIFFQYVCPLDLWEDA
jgi:hypothetical protein